VGQQAYRQAMLEYWGGTCAVTGLALPQALRASHAKPWAECTSDAERLDVFNGFLLSANLDVLFDSFLVSFSDTGELMVFNVIPPSDQQKLGLASGMRLRWISVQHGPYLGFHRQRFLQMTTESSQIQRPGNMKRQRNLQHLVESCFATNS
jgi:putative restriction endonuclease